MNAIEFGPTDRELFQTGAGERIDRLRTYLAPGVFEGSDQATLCEQLLEKLRAEGSLVADRQKPKSPDGPDGALGGLWRWLKDRVSQGHPGLAANRTPTADVDPHLTAAIQKLAHRSLALEPKWLLALVVSLPPAARTLLLQLRQQLRPTAPLVVEAPNERETEEGV